MRRILVTGGAGFVGSHLADKLIAAGHSVTAVDDLSTGSLENIEQLRSHEAFHFVRSDINDRIVLDRLASEAETIFHLAAAVGVRLIVDDPVRTIETNILGTDAVLKAASRYGCRVVVASTSEVYGKGVRIPFREDDDVVLGPTSKSRWAYAASKMIDEFLALAYQRQFSLDCRVARLFNTVGPRQTGRYGMVIPRFVRQALAGSPLTVFGDGTQQRCFCDVRDVVRALECLEANPDASGRVFNVGSKEEVSILQLAELVRELCRSSSEVVFVPYSEAYGVGFEDMERRVPDASAIESVAGWKPEFELRETIRAVIDHERSRRRPESDDEAIRSSPSVRSRADWNP